ncbi:hypothetical protein P8A18_01185 [Streptomyces castrisilvae]|uniref:Secreted protein n=1 Tax=Streptomyces castrisilvae TaxID=3033811 RepID=A0ABY9HC96_9ACTN|nr:hypothetical protein [Streptomyces sp. Mut1]WLQ32136.1 hypothetical protein P8A18_01185 [Streptomyces sp. Mut1]
MTKDTDRAPRTPAEAPGAPTNRPVVPEPAAGTGTGAARPSDDASARPPRTTAPAPPGAADAARTASVAPTGETDMDTGHTAAAPVPAGGTAPHGAPDAARPLIATGDQDKLAHRLQQAVTDFVESPHRAVEEAESTFDAAVTGLTDALRERRRTLHVPDGDGSDPGSRTEELRVTLQHYRDITERLLKV